jgi:hypothetical protein
MSTSLELRHWSRRWSGGVLAAVLALFAFAVPAADLLPVTKLVIGAGFFAAEFVCFRAVIMGVRADDDALVITDLLSRRRLPWDDIDDFALSGRGIERKLLVVLKNGDEVSLGAIMPAVWAPHREATLSWMELTLRRWVQSAHTHT